MRHQWRPQRVFVHFRNTTNTSNHTSLLFRRSVENSPIVVFNRRISSGGHQQISCCGLLHLVYGQTKLTATTATTTAMSSTKPSDPIEFSKWNVAKHAADLHIRSDQAIGVGTGSTAKYLVDHISEKYKNGELKNIVCVPSSFQARHLILEGDLPLSDLERHPELDICIDGADEVDAQLNCIKGGGGCLTQEKVVQSCARKFFVIADHRKDSINLGDTFPRLPLEVIPIAYVPVQRKVEQLLGGACSLRMASKKAGPIITDNGNYILDWEFPKGQPKNWKELHAQLKLIPGMVETGLFVGVTEAAYFGQPDGSVKTREPQQMNGNGHH